MSVKASGVKPHHIDRLGFVMVLCAAIAWSTGGFFVRLLGLDTWTMLGWRSLFGAIAILAFAVWQSGARNLRWRALLNGPGLLVVLCSGIAMTAFIASNVMTSVANVAVLYATLPFITAAIAWVWLKERPSRRTMIASLAALVGVIVMAGNSIGGGHLAGDALALAMTALTAILTVTVRRYRDVPVLEGIIAGSLLAMVIGLALGDSASVTAIDLVWLAIFGVITMGLGMALYTVGARRIPSAQAALLGAVETPLAPFWVWLAFSEIPAFATLIGGALILTALVWHFAGELRR